MKRLHEKPLGRRAFLKGAGGTIASVTAGGCSSLERLFQKHFVEMTSADIEAVRARLLSEYRRKYGRDFVLGTEPARDGTLYGYGLDISRCVGCRRCVYACVRENNQTRSPQIHYIRVHRFEKGNFNFEESDQYYPAGMMPQEGYFYVPVQCQQCENPPCVRACPTSATWKEPDGLVVVDYDWCIGCRYCMAACPYMARWFNFTEPGISPAEMNPYLHYLGNRPRRRGVVEKCTFCIQRVRKGRYPACVEACPVGTRKFGNLLDPESEISKIIETKRVFRLKEDLNTLPKFYYFFTI